MAIGKNLIMSLFWLPWPGIWQVECAVCNRRWNFTDAAEAQAFGAEPCPLCEDTAAACGHDWCAPGEECVKRPVLGWVQKEDQDE